MHEEAEKFLRRAASVELTMLLETEEVSIDLEQMRALDPGLVLECGNRPIEDGVVFVSKPGPFTVLLCTRTGNGIGVYLKVSWREGTAPEQTSAIDPECGPAETQAFSNPGKAAAEQEPDFADAWGPTEDWSDWQ
jgi:hypothetical protein